MGDILKMPERPGRERNCVDCGARLAMKQVNVPGVKHTLLYVCEVCGATLTVPPRL